MVLKLSLEDLQGVWMSRVHEVDVGGSKPREQKPGAVQGDQRYQRASLLASPFPLYFQLSLLPRPCDLRAQEGAFQISYKTSFSSSPAQAASLPWPRFPQWLASSSPGPPALQFLRK